MCIGEDKGGGGTDPYHEKTTRMDGMGMVGVVGVVAEC